MKRIIPICLLFSCTDQASLGRFCSTDECYSGPPETKNIGECRTGKPVCDGSLNIIECRGEILPTEEICDSKDQNCDGYVDNNIYVLHPYSFWSEIFGLSEYPCLSLGECKNGTAKCIDGSWKCFYPETVETIDGTIVEKETRCDNLDNNCDGRIDEELFQSVYCYSGPVGTEINSPCHPGVIQCQAGTIECVNETLPVEEICDAIDNDCSGIIDDTLILLNADFDVVFIVDTSRSMATTITAVARALEVFAAQYDNNENYRFALVIMSSPVGELVQVDTDFTDFATIRFRIQSLQANGYFFEASLDGMYDVCEQSNPLLLSWRPEANKMIFTFTDEMPQTYRSPIITRQLVSDACINSGTFLFIWAKNATEFRPIAENTGGVYFSLIDDWQQMFEDMNSIVIKMCR